MSLCHMASQSKQNGDPSVDPWRLDTDSYKNGYPQEWSYDKCGTRNEATTLLKSRGLREQQHQGLQRASWSRAASWAGKDHRLALLTHGADRL